MYVLLSAHVPFYTPRVDEIKDRLLWSYLNRNQPDLMFYRASNEIYFLSAFYCDLMEGKDLKLDTTHIRGCLT